MTEMFGRSRDKAVDVRAENKKGAGKRSPVGLYMRQPPFQANHKASCGLLCGGGSERE